jgi:hypothetical protein
MLVTVEVIKEGAFTLLSDMERLDLIRINNLARNNTPEKKRLSEQFAGALRLSDVKYEAYQNAIQKGKNEWDKDTY